MTATSAHSDFSRLEVWQGEVRWGSRKTRKESATAVERATAARASSISTAKIGEPKAAEEKNGVNPMNKPRQKRTGDQRRKPKDDRDDVAGLGIYVLDRRKDPGRRPVDRIGSSKNAKD